MKIRADIVIECPNEREALDIEVDTMPAGNRRSMGITMPCTFHLYRFAVVRKAGVSDWDALVQVARDILAQDKRQQRC